jgi:hypothetical protein
MKKERLSMVAICATVITLLVVFALPSGASTTVLQARLKGAAAAAQFESVDGSGCIVTDVFVQGQQVKQSKNSGVLGGATAFVSVSEFDQCTFLDLVEAAGQASLPAGAFQIDSKLTAASLVASVDVTDLFTSNTFTVDLNVAWTASGAATTTKSHFQQKSGGFTIIENNHDSSVDATANGTITQGGATLVSGDALFATMFNANDGSIQITKS